MRCLAGCPRKRRSVAAVGVSRRLVAGQRRLPFLFAGIVGGVLGFAAASRALARDRAGVNRAGGAVSALRAFIPGGRGQLHLTSCPQISSLKRHRLLRPIQVHSDCWFAMAVIVRCANQK